jgi:hypothetical protein
MGVKKKTSPLVWILVGVLAFFVLIGGLFIAGGLFVAKKVVDSTGGTDAMQKNPALAAARMMATLNPDVEIVSTDENAGTLTVREKSSGKVITMNADDIKNGKLTFSDSTGAKVSIGGGTDVKLPEWLPAYPGVKMEGGISAASGDGSGGMATFKTNDESAKVLSFYREGLKASGLTETSTVNFSGAGSGGKGGALTMQDEAQKRHATITVNTTDEGTQVSLIYGSKN